MSFYTAIIILTIFSFIVLAILVYENGRIPKKTKHKCYAAYVTIVLAALAEWGASMFNNTDISTKGIHMFIKVLDYIITPIAGIFFVRMVCDNNKRQKIYWAVLVVNFIMQIAFLFVPGNEWKIFYIDDNNVNQNAKLYFLYILIYAIIIGVVIFETILYSKKFKNRNITSLILILLLIVIGIILQEFGSLGTDNVIRTDYIALALGSAFMFIHYCEYYQLSTDDVISTQKNISVTDPLTALYNRFAYGEKIVELKNGGYTDFIIYAIDINGLKKANDTLGHEAGDELIKAVSIAIKNSFGKYGECYRTGGDEFVCVTVDANENPDSVAGEFRLMLKNWHGVKIKTASASVGFAKKSDFPNESIEQISNHADMRMYMAKRDYYNKSAK